MLDHLRAAVRYGRTHHAAGYLAGLVVLATADVLFGSRELVLPLADVPIAYRHEIPVAYAVLPAATLHSPMADFEQGATGRYQHVRRVHLILVVVLTAAAQLGVEAASDSWPAGVAALRSVLIWAGVALLSARLLGITLSWVLPLVSILPLTFLQQNADGTDRWWDWTRQPPGALGCWLIAAASLTLGLMLFHLDRWTPRRRRSQPRPDEGDSIEGAPPGIEDTPTSMPR
ncbi:hypothetical protein [Frankia sp. R82]|uniref:hypothetical protein n=1 Tax=Frankia sp. R82 TaxID=2950553 RepID=UPI0020448938|nr:hypothetical protein [Frankia sp. R82]MCM3887595.1 hypothetical protein [Frankia sp. R82]